MAAPGVSGSRQEEGRRQPAWQVWQQVTESQPGRYRVSEPVLPCLEGTEAPSRKPSADTVPRNGAPGRGSLTKNEVGAQSQKGHRS